MITIGGANLIKDCIFFQLKPPLGGLREADSLAFRFLATASNMDGLAFPLEAIALLWGAALLCLKSIEECAGWRMLHNLKEYTGPKCVSYSQIIHQSESA